MSRLHIITKYFTNDVYWFKVSLDEIESYCDVYAESFSKNSILNNYKSRYDKVISSDSYAFYRDCIYDQCQDSGLTECTYDEILLMLID